MPKIPNRGPWLRHPKTPEIPIVIIEPMRLVQIKEDAVRGRCCIARAIEVDWTRVTHWRWGGEGAIDDYSSSDPNKMSLQECDEKRREVDAERTRVQAALLVAKRRQDDAAIRDLGHSIEEINRQASEIKLRRHALAAKANGDAYKRAAQEILPPDLLRKLYARANAIQEEMWG